MLAYLERRVSLDAGLGLSPPQRSLVDAICHHFSFGPHSPPCGWLECPYSVDVRPSVGRHQEVERGCPRERQQSSCAVDQLETELFAKARGSFVRGRGPGWFPICRLPAELRNKIYWHILAEEQHHFGDRAYQRHSLNLLSTCRQVRREAQEIFRKSATLTLDLSVRVLVERDRCGAPITYDSFLDNKNRLADTLGDYIRDLDWVLRFSQLVLTAPQPAAKAREFPVRRPEADARSTNAGHWETVALNLQAFFALVGPRSSAGAAAGFAPRKISLRLGLGRVARCIPNIKHRDGAVGDDPVDALTVLEGVMLTHRSSYQQMSPAERGLYLWNPGPVSTSQSRDWHVLYPRPEKRELAHMFGVLTWVGNFFQATDGLRLEMAEDEGAGGDGEAEWQEHAAGRPYDAYNAPHWSDDDAGNNAVFAVIDDVASDPDLIVVGGTDTDADADGDADGGADEGADGDTRKVDEGFTGRRKWAVAPRRHSEECRMASPACKCGGADVKHLYTLADELAGTGATEAMFWLRSD